MRIDQPDEPDVPQPHRADASEPEPEQRQAASAPESADAATRTERSQDYRARVERAQAIDRAYERLAEAERSTVTPAMRRIEAEDPDRHLAGLDNRLKGTERLAEKVEFDFQKMGRGVDQAIANVKDVIRYTFVYSEEAYTRGVYADCDRLQEAGFERFDRRNSWDHDEYKGINSRWRIPQIGQIFEVQFHTHASLAAKEETHAAYERIRSLPEDDEEVARLHEYQRQVTSKVPVPPGALGVPDYRFLGGVDERQSHLLRCCGRLQLAFRTRRRVAPDRARSRRARRTVRH